MSNLDTIDQNPNDGTLFRFTHVPHGSRAIEGKICDPSTGHDGNPLPPSPESTSYRMMLVELEEKLFQQYSRSTQNLEGQFYCKLQECEDKWYARYEKQSMEIGRKSAEIGNLIAIALYERDEKLKLQDNYNLRGGLERLVFQARLIKKISMDYRPAVQEGLDELAKTQEFQKAILQEVTVRGLTLGDVIPCIGFVYNAVSKRSYGNDLIVTLYEEDHSEGECAVLATFLKVQAVWPVGFQWRKKRSRWNAKD